MELSLYGMSEIATAPSAPIERLAFSITEACQALGGISRPTLYRLTARHLISPVRGLGRTIYARAEILRFLEAQTKIAAN